MKAGLAAVVLGVAALLVISAPPAAASALIVKLGTVVPDGSIWHQVLKQLGADWRRDTAGRVTLRVFAGTQGDEPTMIRKMRINQLQAASLTAIGLGDIDEAFNVFGIPMFYNSYAELDHVMDRLTPVLKARLEAKGFVLLNWGNAGWVQVFSKQPVKTVDDLKRLKLFTSAGDDRMVQWYKRNGFNPVPLAVTDMLTSLQTGMIDALPAPPLAALSFQWYTHTPYMLDIGLGPVVGATVITKRAWDEIDEADRARVLEAAAKAETRLQADVPKQDKAAIAEMEKRGLEIIPAGDRQAWAAAARTFAETMRGSMVPADIFDQALRERDAYRSRAGGVQP